MKPNKYWFKPKDYGYGAQPCSWEGWLMTLGLILAIVGIAALVGLFDPNIVPKDIFRFLFYEALFIILFVVIARRKTKERWGWRWGKKK